MKSVLIWFAYDTSIAGAVSTIFAMISELIAIDTPTYGCMSLFGTYWCAYSSIKCIQISKPVSIIVGIDIFDHSTIELIDLIDTSLSHQDCCFFASDSASTIADDFFASKLVFVCLEMI